MYTFERFTAMRTYKFAFGMFCFHVPFEILGIISSVDVTLFALMFQWNIITGRCSAMSDQMLMEIGPTGGGEGAQWTLQWILKKLNEIVQ